MQCHYFNPYFAEQLWELLQEKSLLDGLEPESDTYSCEAHFAPLISLLGPPPQEVLDQADSPVNSSLYDTQGDFKHPKFILPTTITFSDRTTALQGEDKRLSVEFASGMIRWLPEERSTAKELYNDAWLYFQTEIDLKSKRIYNK